MKKIKEEIGDILLSNESVLVLLWSKDRGWQVFSHADLAIDELELTEDGLWGLKSIVLEDDQALYDSFLDRIKEALDEGESVPSEIGNVIESAFHLMTLDGTYGYYKIECHLKKDESGTVEKILVRVPELEAEDVYRIHLAEVITNDRNPSFFAQGAKELMDKHPDWTYALVQFDVVKFKMINEQYGEAFGDEMLEYFIHTLKLLCNKEQLYARLTGDVFMVLTPYETKETLLEFVEYLRSNLSDYKNIPYRLVFGICEILDKSKNLRRYGDGASLARQSIKEDALNHVAFYKKDMRESERAAKYIEDHMEKALKNHEFVMYLQPKYSISQDKMIGAEALVRWIHPKYGIVPPMEFIPLFEKNGFIIKMDKYIWEEACKLICKWLDAGIEPIPISVNVSRRHLKNGVFVKDLNSLVEKYNIPKQYLEIEITETVEEKDYKESVKLLKDNGFTLLMDDFGSGYSSLNMLKDTQFDVIKIDREFLRNFIASDRGRSIVEHTIKMTKAIGLEPVAEGVETKEQAEFLSDCGCDMAQGFYYAKPMTLDEFNEQYPVKEDKES